MVNKEVPGSSRRRQAMVLVAFSLFLSGSITAADFRALDIGGSCEDIAAAEAALGSTPIEWPALQWGVMHAFEGRAFDSGVRIAYLCSDGKLVTGNFFFQAGDLTAALANYGIVHAELSKTHGDAYLDNSRWMQPMDSRWLESDPEKYSTTWRTPRVWVTMNILPIIEAGRPGLQLAISYVRPSKDTGSDVGRAGAAQE